MLATTTKVPTILSNCFACLREGLNSSSTALRIKVHHTCHSCQLAVTGGVFYVCRKSPIQHIFCVGCHKEKNETLNPEKIEETKGRERIEENKESVSIQETQDRYKIEETKGREIPNGLRQFNQTQIRIEVPQYQLD